MAFTVPLPKGVFMKKVVLLAALITFSIAAPVAPMYAQTQMDMNKQAGNTNARADEELTKVYKALMTKVSDPGKILLRDAERAWITYRDRQCDFDTAGSEGGSIHSMAVVDCRTELTKAHTAELKKQLDCQEGDTSCGSQ
jgi:uncharacterized protein YecT (DUF1311 family)